MWRNVVRGYGDSSGRGCGLLSDKLILKLSGEPCFSMKPNPIPPNFFFLTIWNNNRTVLWVIRNQVTMTFSEEPVQDNTQSILLLEVLASTLSYKMP